MRYGLSTMGKKRYRNRPSTYRKPFCSTSAYHRSTASKARQLRKTQGNSFRIVACTGYAQEAIRDQLRDAPFDVILQKPVALETILDALTGSA